MRELADVKKVRHIKLSVRTDVESQGIRIIRYGDEHPIGETASKVVKERLVVANLGADENPRVVGHCIVNRQARGEGDVYVIVNAVEAERVIHFAGDKARAVFRRAVVVALNVIGITVARPPADHVGRRRKARYWSRSR